MKTTQNHVKPSQKIEQKVPTKDRKPVMTMSKSFLEVLRLGVKDRDNAIAEMESLLKKTGVTTTRSGRALDLDVVGERFDASLYDVLHSRGKWRKYELLNTPNSLKLVLKKPERVEQDR